jgi:hypothetical protein
MIFWTLFFCFPVFGFGSSFLRLLFNSLWTSLQSDILVSFSLFSFPLLWIFLVLCFYSSSLFSSSSSSYSQLLHHSLQAFPPVRSSSLLFLSSPYFYLSLLESASGLCYHSLICSTSLLILLIFLCAL